MVSRSSNFNRYIGQPPINMNEIKNFELNNNRFMTNGKNIALEVLRCDAQVNLASIFPLKLLL